MKSTITQYGFDFGSMTITRTCSDKTSSVVNVTTKKAKFSIRANNNGSMRFYDDQGNELELVHK